MKCIKCHALKPIEEFSKTNRNVLGRMHTCKSCCAEGLMLNLCERDSYFKHLASNHRHTAKTRNMAFNLDWLYLKNLYEKQNRLCFYTDIELRIARGHGHSKLSLSLDRVVPEKGYVKGNVVLVTKRANLVKNDLTLTEMKAWLPSWYAKLENGGYVPKSTS